MKTTEEPKLESTKDRSTDFLEEPAQEPLRASLVRQFVLMPLFVVVTFAVIVGSIILLFGLFGTEGRTARDYLNDVKTSSGTARWQAAINLVAELEKAQHSREARELQPEIVSLLEQSKGEGEAELRYFLVTALGWIGDREALGVVKAAIDDPDLQVKKTALLSLMKIGNGDAAPILIECLRAEESEVRAQAAWQLGFLKESEAAKPLEVALNDPRQDVRLNAAWALAELNRASAVPQLVLGLGRDYVSTVYANDGVKTREALAQSIRAIAKLGHTGAVDVLKKISAEDPDLTVRDEAITALKALGR